ncbi:MAG: DUF438 domain-containing protein [Planctomycetota bacterium]|jgi:DUF438 domain-containing protein
MAEQSNIRRAQTLIRFFKRINQGEDPKLLRREAHRLLPSVDPNDIAAAEQNLINEGYPVPVVQLLSATFMLMTIPEQHNTSPKTWLAPNHLLSMVIVEHDLTRCLIADLNDVVEVITGLYHLTDVSSEFRKLAHLVEHLSAIKKHFEREDDVIFPCLRKHGRISFCSVMQQDHVSIRTEIDNLACLMASFGTSTIEQFQTALVRAARHLTAIVPEHFSQEEMILFPIALGMINNPGIWQHMKAFCDEIGYCGVHL